MLTTGSIMSNEKKAFACLIAALMVVTFVRMATAEPWAYNPPQSNRQAYKPYQGVCHIKAGNVQGSGTLIATRGGTALVLSCRHVNEVEGARVTISWPLAGNQVTPGTVHKVIRGEDWGTDIAVIICRRPAGVAPIRVVKFNADHGPWVGAGWRSGQLRVAVSKQAEQRGNEIWLESPGMAFVGGQSGGCLFNRYGQLVGVIVASDRYSTSICADGPLLHQIIDQYRRGR